MSHKSELRARDEKAGEERGKGKWRVFSQMIGSEKMYIVGRQLDESKPLHGGNVEYHGGYTDIKEEAQAGADYLNKVEALKSAV